MKKMQGKKYWGRVILGSQVKMQRAQIYESGILSGIAFLGRGPNLFFKYFYFHFGTGLFYPFGGPAKVQIFLGSLEKTHGF